MVRKASPLVALGMTVLMLGGCSFSTDALWPSLSGGEPTAANTAVPQAIQIQPSQAERAAAKPMAIAQPQAAASAPPKLGTTNFQVQAPRDGAATGTFVGKKVLQLRDDLRRLQGAASQHNADLQVARKATIVNANGYHGVVAGIRSGLQVGTTPGNPMLVNKWNHAQAQLERVNADIGNMNQLSNRVAADASMASYLLDSTRAAFSLSGAVDEDHRQLAVLEDDVNRTVVLVDRLLTELSDDIRRQSSYVASERSDLNTLALAIKNGEFFGASLASRSYNMPTAVSPATASGPTSSMRGRRPLVVIRFDRPNVKYQQALYSAVSQALQRRPNATFDLVAVTPLQAGSTARVALDANAARRNAQAVLRSLTDMGLPPSRVALSATTANDASSNEVRLFVR
jgi:hypothetical protein